MSRLRASATRAIRSSTYRSGTVPLPEPSLAAYGLPCAAMFLSDFDYGLPAELIARYPTSERCGSRLLVVGAELDDRRFGDVPELFAPGDLLILNDTRVIRARLFGRKLTGGRVEILVERILVDGEVLAQVVMWV